MSQQKNKIGFAVAKGRNTQLLDPAMLIFPWPEMATGLGFHCRPVDLVNPVLSHAGNTDFFLLLLLS